MPTKKTDDPAVSVPVVTIAQPPAYSTYGTVYYPTPALLTGECSHARQRRLRQRTCRFIFLEAVAWILLYLVARHVAQTTHWGRHWFGWLPGVYTMPTLQEGKGHIMRCLSPADWETSPTAMPTSDDHPFSLSYSFTLPAAAEVLFLLSRGSNVAGKLNVEADVDLPNDEVRVDVIAKFHSRSSLEQTDVCWMTRGDSGEGVGIFTPRGWPWRPGRRDFFELNIRLPSGSNVSALETDLNYFVHELGDLADSGAIHFGRLDVSTRNAPIRAKSISAERASCRSSNSPIYGQYNVSRTLALETSNAPIHVDIGMIQDFESFMPTEARLETSNAEVITSFSLINQDNEVMSRKQSPGGDFVTHVKTSNGLVVAEFPTSPLSSALTLKVDTSNKAVHVLLHEAYQGTFHLKTINALPLVNVEDDVEDPSGQGRKRYADLRRLGRGEAGGHVFWDEEEADLGSIQVSTSNQPITLNL